MVNLKFGQPSLNTSFSPIHTHYVINSSLYVKGVYFLLVNYNAIVIYMKKDGINVINAAQNAGGFFSLFRAELMVDRDRSILIII